MQPTAVITLIFSDGTKGRMQYYAEDTSDPALQAEIDRSAFAKGAPLSWHREPSASTEDEGHATAQK